MGVGVEADPEASLLPSQAPMVDSEQEKLLLSGTKQEPQCLSWRNSPSVPRGRRQELRATAREARPLTWCLCKWIEPSQQGSENNYSVQETIPSLGLIWGGRNTCTEGKAPFQEVHRRFKKRRVFERGTGAHTTGYVLEAAMAAQDVAPGLADQHAVHGQHVQPHLQQDILQPTR